MTKYSLLFLMLAISQITGCYGRLDLDNAMVDETLADPADAIIADEVTLIFDDEIPSLHNVYGKGAGVRSMTLRVGPMFKTYARVAFEKLFGRVTVMTQSEFTEPQSATVRLSAEPERNALSLRHRANVSAVLVSRSGSFRKDYFADGMRNSSRDRVEDVAMQDSFRRALLGIVQQIYADEDARAVLAE